MSKKVLRLFLLITHASLLTAFFSGCIRLTGNAGYWKKGADEEQASYHGAGFDTNDLVPSQNPKGNITVGENA